MEAEWALQAVIADLRERGVDEVPVGSLMFTPAGTAGIVSWNPEVVDEMPEGAPNWIVLEDGAVHEFMWWESPREVLARLRSS